MIHDDRHILIIRLHHTDGGFGYGQCQIADGNIAVIALVIGSGTADQGPHVDKILALAQNLHFHLTAQRHIRFRPVALDAVKNAVPFGFHHQRIIRDRAPGGVPQGHQRVFLCGVNPSGHTADTNPAPQSFSASKEHHAVRPVPHGHADFAFLVRCLIEHHSGIRRPGIDHIILEAAGFRDRFNGKEAIQSALVRILEHIGPVPDDSHHMDLLARGHRSDRRRLVIRSRKQIDVVTPHTGQIDLRRTALPKPAVCAVPVCFSAVGTENLLLELAHDQFSAHLHHIV